MNLLSPGNPAEYLAARYSGSLDTRALWEWAGGRPDEAVFDEDPAARWKTLWEKAASGKTASDVALLREALFDRPGDEEGLAIVEKLGTERWSRWKPPAEHLLTQIDVLLPEIGPDQMWLALQSFPNLEHLVPKPADCAFALLARPVEARFTSAARDRLESTVSGIRAGRKPPLIDEFPHFIGEMLGRAARSSFEDAGPAAFRIQEGVSSLRAAVLSREFSGFIAAAAASFESLKTMDGASARGSISESVSAALRVAAAMRSLREGEPTPSISGICDGLVHSIWATSPAKPAVEAANQG